MKMKTSKKYYHYTSGLMVKLLLAMQMLRVRFPAGILFFIKNNIHCNHQLRPYMGLLKN